MADEKGTIQTARTGHQQTAPWFTNMNKQHELILKHMKELGFYKIQLKPIIEKCPDFN